MYTMFLLFFFVTHIQTEKISSWNGPTVHVCCFMLARASTKTFVSRVRKTAKKKSSLAEKFVRRVTRTVLAWRHLHGARILEWLLHFWKICRRIHYIYVRFPRTMNTIQCKTQEFQEYATCSFIRRRS